MGTIVLLDLMGGRGAAAMERAHGPERYSACLWSRAPAFSLDGIAKSTSGIRCGGRADSFETTSLHLDVLRDLKRINSHICSVAYPALETVKEISAKSEEAATPQAKPRPRER